MADDPPAQHPPAPTTNANPNDRHVQLEAKVEDAETRAAREELKQTAISDKKDPSIPTPTSVDSDQEMKLRSGKKTPDLAPPEALSHGDAAREKRAASPKKKRAHDEVDQIKEGDGHRVSSGTDSDGGWVMVQGEQNDEKHRSEPQKKRARDETSPPADIQNETTATTASTTGGDTKPPGKADKTAQTSSSAFAASGFSKLASSSASPFASIGANKSVFGGGGGGGGAAPAPSPFAAFGSPPPSGPAVPADIAKPTLSFSSKDASAPSPFGTINGPASSGFGGGSVFGGGSAFGSALGGPKISSFASPGTPLITKSDKPAKPFGAPESEAEDDDEDGTDEEADEPGPSGGDADKEDVASREASTPAGGEEEKKTKYKKVFVDDGEAEEATIIQVRARMYYLDKSTNAKGKEEIAWRERGAGILKVNVPAESVSVDPETGGADAKSFDASVLNQSTTENPKLIRLLMRQDSTLRVILNSAILSAKMEFQLKEGLKAKSVLFTAIEGEDARHVQVQMKMSPQSADTFLKAIDGIKKKLEKKDAS